MEFMTSSHIAYFGYGSLVNLNSLRTPYISAHRARLKGWQRAWLSGPKVEGSFDPADGLASLSAEKHPAGEIEGLVIIDHAASLAALNEREALYCRVDIAHTQIEFLDDNPLSPEAPLFLYVANLQPATSESKILRSYLDVVMQGYQTHFGQQGLTDFVTTTVGWDTAVLEDRHKPIYPRNVELTNEECGLFDTVIRRVK